MHSIDYQIIDYLTKKANEYCTYSFIETDPISIPHGFQAKHDQEIAGFFAAILAWGNRKMILKNANELMQQMDLQPEAFIRSASTHEINALQPFKHRTIKGDDIIAMVYALRKLYQSYGGLEPLFSQGYKESGSLYGALAKFRTVFTDGNFLDRTQKHIPNVEKKSAAKRMVMFLRWMVRDSGPDFGLWKDIPKSALMLPLDVHTGRIGRQLGLLHRKQDDWKAVEEITASLQAICPEDPIKYDYALFGIGVFEKEVFIP